MKKLYSIVRIVLVGFLVTSFSDISFGQQESPEERVLISFKEGVGRRAAEQHEILVRNFGGDVHHSFRLLPLVSAKLSKSMIVELKEHAEIVYVEDDIIMHAIQQEIPWGVTRIDADMVWSTNTGSGVDVAILDTGIDYDHPDLVDNIAGGVNYTGLWFRDGSTHKFYWDDRNGHGSHCAGIVAASNNNIGVVGVAPGASLWAVKVLGDDSSGYVSDIIQGLEWCVEHGIEVVSMSFAGDYSESLENACSTTNDAGVLLVAAAGNEYGGAVTYPAAHNSVIAVSGTSASDSIAGFSSVGPEVDFAAPAVNIKSTYKNGGYASSSGTSMACPHVAGVAALVWASDSSLSKTNVRSRLRETAEDLGTPGADNLYGYGLVNAAAAGTAGEPPSVITYDATTNIIHNSAALNGELSDLGTASLVNVSFEHGIPSGSYTDETRPQSMTAAETLSTVLSGLLADNTYYFKTIDDGTSYGGEMIFNTEAGVVFSEAIDAAMNIAAHYSATLNGELIDLGTASSVVVSFEYGTSSGNYTDETSPQTMTATGTFSATLSNLDPESTYYFRAKAAGDGTSYGDEMNFTTGAGVAPSVATDAAINITHNSATLNGELSTLGTASSVDVSFELGTSPGSYTYETSPQTMTATGTFSITVSNLVSERTYYFRAKAAGDGTNYGSEMSFTTKAGVATSVTTGAATDTTHNSATLNGELSNLGTASSVNVSFEYGTSSGNYSNQTSPQTKTAAGTFSATLSNLKPKSIYYFRAKAVGDDTSYGAEKTFTTKEAPSAPTAYVTIDMSKQTFWIWWIVSATVTITDDHAVSIQRAKVEGRWSGAYGGNVSGTTNYYGQISSSTGFIQTNGIVTFTVNKVIKDGQEYNLSGQIEDSIAGP